MTEKPRVRHYQNGDWHEFRLAVPVNGNGGYAVGDRVVVVGGSLHDVANEAAFLIKRAVARIQNDFA